MSIKSIMLQTAAMLAMAETGMPPVSKNIYVNDKKMSRIQQ